MGRQGERPRPYLKTGVHRLKRAVQTFGACALPGRSIALGRALHEWRASLVVDLGGEAMVSTQQRALIDMATTTKPLVDSVDVYILSMPSPVNRQKRCLFAVVKKRQSLVNQLQSLLRDLGLERRAKDVDVAAQLAALHRAVPTQAPTSPADAANPTPAPVGKADE